MKVNGTLLKMLRLQMISCQIHPRFHTHTRRILAQTYCTRIEKLPSSLLRHFRSQMKANGPVTVAEYMKVILTNPISGYYMNKDVFGAKGDFITSPEISQMFGELLGIWCIHEWMQSGSPEHIQIVELGPGRGTLADDMLRTFSQVSQIHDKVSLHLVEISPTMSDLQVKKLCNKGEISNQQNSTSHKQCRSRHGVDVAWYKNVQDVPKAFSFFIAHEFFDALPIHKFQKTKLGWREVMIHYEGDDSSLKYVLSPGSTLASNMILDVNECETRAHIEVSPESGAIIQEIASRIQEHGGSALIADYGHNGEKEDTFRAFSKHKLVDPLIDPGSADLTADVDFSYFKNCLKKMGDLAVFGPITQEQFLHNMGIGVRLQVLLQKADWHKREDLISGYDMLTNSEKMGERFKFFNFSKTRNKDYIPAGFKPLS